MWFDGRPVIKPDQPLGKLLRLPLRSIPPDAAIPILTGPGRGLRWRVGSGTHGCWLGTYEREKVALLHRLLGPKSVFVDVGAHAGYFSLVAARTVGQDGAVVAIEPDARNIQRLRDHIALNCLTNVAVHEAAAGASNGWARFQSSHSSYQGRLSGEGVPMQVVTLDTAVASTHRRVDLIKIDVEGAEYDVLQGTSLLLRRDRPVLLLATHSVDLRRKCEDLLASHGYLTNRLTDVLELLAVAAGTTDHSA